MAKLLEDNLGEFETFQLTGSLKVVNKQGLEGISNIIDTEF
jgi:hypothetical protein